MKVTLACAGGVSTSMLCSKIIDEGKKYGVDIDCHAYSVMEVDKYIEDSDLVLVGPQVKYMLKTMQDKFPNKTIDLIDMRDYGSMNAANIMKKYLDK